MRPVDTSVGTVAGRVKRRPVGPDSSEIVDCAAGTSVLLPRRAESSPVVAADDTAVHRSVGCPAERVLAMPQ